MPLHRHLNGFLLLCTLAAPACAAPPSAPESLARAIERGLERCQVELHCDTSPCVSSGALRGCFDTAQSRWDAQTERIEATLATRDPWCTTFWEQQKDKQATYAEDALTTPALADGAYNTDDDLKVLLAQQRYELAYRVLQFDACRPRKR